MESDEVNDKFLYDERNTGWSFGRGNSECVQSRRRLCSLRKASSREPVLLVLGAKWLENHYYTKKRGAASRVDCTIEWLAKAVTIAGLEEDIWKNDGRALFL